jgi:hypothetical protein
METIFCTILLIIIFILFYYLIKLILTGRIPILNENELSDEEFERRVERHYSGERQSPVFFISAGLFVGIMILIAIYFYNCESHYLEIYNYFSS